MKKKRTTIVLFNINIIVLIFSVICLGFSSVLTKTNAQLLLAPPAGDIATQPSQIQQNPSVVICTPVPSQQLQLPPESLPPAADVSGLINQLPPESLPPAADADAADIATQPNQIQQNPPLLFNQPATIPTIPAANVSSALNQLIPDIARTQSTNDYISPDNQISQNDRAPPAANNRDLSTTGLSSDVNVIQSPFRTINNSTIVQSSPNQPVGLDETFRPFLFNSTLNSSSNPGINLSENAGVELERAYNTDNKHSASVESKDTSLPLKNDNNTSTTAGIISVQNNTQGSPESIIATSNITTNSPSNQTKDNNTGILSLKQSTSNVTDIGKLNNTQNQSLRPADNITTGTAAISSNNQNLTCDLQITDGVINQAADTKLHERMTTVGAPTNLISNSSEISSCDPTLAMSDNSTYVVMTEGDEENREIFLKSTTNGGNTFNEMIPISDGIPSAAFNPQVAVSGENVYVAWQDENPDTGVHDIYLRKSTDKGNTFGDIINLSKDYAGSGDPHIFASGKKVFVTWDGTSPEGNGIFFRQSTDGGNTFTDTVKLSNGQGIPFLPKIKTAFGNNIEIVWLNNLNGNSEVLSSKSVDAGNTFNNIQKLSNDVKEKIWKNN